MDDEDSLLGILNEVFSHNGYKVHLASSAQAALELLQTQTVAIMVSDVIMPDVDGFELANIVRQQYPDIKIVLASGYTENRHLVKENAKQQFPLVQKPYKPRALLKQIRNMLDDQQEKI